MDIGMFGIFVLAIVVVAIAMLAGEKVSDRIISGPAPAPAEKPDWKGFDQAEGKGE